MSPERDLYGEGHAQGRADYEDGNEYDPEDPSQEYHDGYEDGWYEAEDEAEEAARP